MKKKFYWIIVFLYIGFIFSNSLQPGDISGAHSGIITTYVLPLLKYLHLNVEYDVLHHFIRKLAHFSEYFFLFLLVILAIKKNDSKLKWLIIVLFMIIVPSIDEYIQTFVNNRSGNLKDVLIDMSGYLSSLTIYSVIKKARSK